ncbi:MAG: phosphotransferase [Gemmatimonadota bacterium]|nr:phosphotransferase [Gemmatimonadota bacterium]
MTLRYDLRPGLRASTRFGATGRHLVPLEDRDALLWFLRHLHVPHGLRARLGRLAAVASTRVAPEFALPTIEAALFEARGRYPTRDPARELVVRAVEALAGRLPGVVPDRWIVVRDHPCRPRGRTLLFPFAPGDPEPMAAVRVRARGAGQSLEAEAAALEDARGRLPADLAATVPEVLYAADLDGAGVLVESRLAGRSAYVAMRSGFAPARLAAGHLKAAARWLGSFHAATRRDDGGVAVHGDFWPRNLLLDDAGAAVGVVDWEAYRPAGPWDRDLFDFPVGYALAWPWADEGRREPLIALSRAFLADGPVAQAIRGYLRLYSAITGTEPDRLRKAFPDYVDRRAKVRREEVPWNEFRRRLDRTDRSVFSG